MVFVVISHHTRPKRSSQYQLQRHKEDFTRALDEWHHSLKRALKSRHHHQSTPIIPVPERLSTTEDYTKFYTQPNDNDWFCDLMTRMVARYKLSSRRTLVDYFTERGHDAQHDKSLYLPHQRPIPSSKFKYICSTHVSKSLHLYILQFHTYLL